MPYYIYFDASTLIHDHKDKYKTSGMWLQPNNPFHKREFFKVTDDVIP